MSNYDVVKSACKKRLMDLGMDQGTAQVLARGRKFWLPYVDRKPIIETDWEELYDIFIEGAFPMGFDVDKSIKESHKRGFMNLLSEMQTQLRRSAEMNLLDLQGYFLQPAHLQGTKALKERYRLIWENKSNQINNWNRDGISYDFLNWQDNPLEVK